MDSQGWHPKLSYLITDSLSAIQALQNGKSRSRPDKVDNLLSLLNLASTVKFSISIEWIPAHVGIEGNESADMAAKEAMNTGIQDFTRPSKSEIYYIVNNAINKKWQSQWTHNNKGRMLHFGQPTVKTQCDVYSTNRRLDTVYTGLRLGHCGLGFHHPGSQSGLCQHCGDPKVLDHVFDCESHTVHRRDLKAAVFKLGYTQIGLWIILFPPRLRKMLIQYKMPSLSSCEKPSISIRSNNFPLFFIPLLILTPKNPKTRAQLNNHKKTLPKQTIWSLNYQ